MSEEKYSLIKSFEKIDKMFEEGKIHLISKTGLEMPKHMKRKYISTKSCIRIVQKHLVCEQTKLYYTVDRGTFDDVVNRINHSFGLRSVNALHWNVVFSVSKLKKLAKWGECKEEMIYKITGKTPEYGALFAFGDEEEILEQKDTNECKKISPRPKIYLDSKEFQEKINKRKK